MKKNEVNKSEVKISESEEECFIIMPISDPLGYDSGHFQKVYEDIFIPACLKAGYKAKRADDVKATNLIHLDILKRVVESPMAICDLSNRNPNVLFELGLRQAFDKPTVLVQEVGTERIFDISPLRVTDYRRSLGYREVLEDQDCIAEAINHTREASKDPNEVLSIVSLLSLSNPASLKDINGTNTEQLFQILMRQISNIQEQIMRNDHIYVDTASEVKNTDKYAHRAVEIERRALFYMFKEFTELLDINDHEGALAVGRRFMRRFKRYLVDFPRDAQSEVITLTAKRVDDYINNVSQKGYEYQINNAT